MWGISEVGDGTVEFGGRQPVLRGPSGQ